MDIDYLKKNGGKYSSTIYIDSAKRNRMFYPNANNYEVVFSEPFRNVCSIQVLDASIPRTHYNVDSHNNALCYQQANVDYIAYIDVGDYTDTELLDAINFKLNGISIEFLSSPSERRKQFCFVSASPFKIYPFRSTIRETLGFDQGKDTVLISQDNPVNYEHTVFSTTGGGTGGIDVRVTSSALILYQRFVAIEDGKVNQLVLNMSLNDEPSVDLLSSLNQFVLNLNIARVDNGALLKIATAYVSSDSIRSSPNNVSITDWNHTEDLQSAQNYYLLIYTNSSAIVDYTVKVDVVSGLPGDVQLFTQLGVNMVFDESSLVPINNYTFDGGDTVEQRYLGITSDDSGFSMGLVIEMTTSKKRFSVTPPGIYNLLGDRYIILRCKEIENHIMTTIKSFNMFNIENDTVEEKQYETGIAKFKMSVVGFREERFDFNILPPQEFHPIGKLTSLTFSFENQDGKPYDFKGVNHTITLAINYYKHIVSNDNEPNQEQIVYKPKPELPVRYAALQTEYTVSEDLYDPEK